jgi:hypothetical protein
MKTTVGTLAPLALAFMAVLIPSTGTAQDGGQSPARWYVARDGSDTNSGGKAGPLGTVNAALAKAALSGDGPVEIVILGELAQTLTITEGVPPVILRGESSLEPGVLTGTITVGPGACLTLGEGITVTGPGRGVQVLGGNFVLDGGSIADNTAPLAGAGVYVEGGAFTMTGGAVRGNRTARRGGGVYVESGAFTMTGGTVEGNKTGGGKLSGGAGGGVYINAFNGGVFRKTGGAITGNTVPSGYKGHQIFLAAGRACKAHAWPVNEDVVLDSGSDQNWDE